MSKIIAIAVLTTLTLLPTREAPKPSPHVAAADEMEVMVLFGGLMVFNDPGTGLYEVGILGKQHSAGHDFCVQRLGAPRVCRQTAREQSHEENQFLPDGKKWVLSVTSPPNETPVGMNIKEKRRPDVEGQQFDFSWIIDLDGEKFHNKPLQLKPDQFQPIIHLPKVKLFTKYKSPDFVRWQGARRNAVEPFGFVAEAIGFRVSLKRGEELTLKEVDDPANEEIIARIPYVAPSPVGGNYEVLYIYNTRYPQHAGSDFRMYYKLFKPGNVAAHEEYDFEENESHPCESPGDPPCKPLNPAPRKMKPAADKKTDKIARQKFTCCGLVCTPIRLVKWDKALP